jgi:hypothetical protein
MSESMRTRVLSLVGGALALLVAWPIVIAAFNPQPEPPGRFGMVGLAVAQTARLNAVNVLPPDVPPELCRVTLGFLDSDGKTLLTRRGSEIVQEVSIMPGQAAFLDMPAAEVLRGSRRVEFRAGLEFPPATALPLDPCRNIVATLEIFDDLTGRTMVFYPPDPIKPTVDKME